MSSLRFSDVTAAVKAAGNKLIGRTAPEVLIDWRLSVCAECPKLREAKAAKEKVSVALSGQFVDKNVCDVCGCSLVLLASSLNATPHDDTPEEKAARPSTCWFNAE